MDEVAIRTVDGTPRLFLDGAPFEGVMAYTYREHLAEFVRAGVRVFRLSLPIGWSGPGQYDYRETDAAVEAFCAAGPDVRLFPLLWMDGPETKWWELLHAQERALPLPRVPGAFPGGHPAVPRPASPDDRPDPALDNFDRHHQQPPCVHSFASAVWLTEACAALQALLRHLEERFPGRFLGYYICGGLSYEWLGWGTYTDEVLFDYSVPMRDWFRRWLRTRYGTVEHLAAAWGRPIAGFDVVELPEPAQRPAADAHPLLDPVRQAPAADLVAAQSDAQVDCFLGLCRAAKAALPGRRLVGGFYGYWWSQKDVLGPARAGHLALQRVLESADVDFLASPLDYTNRGLGGASSAQAPADAAADHGKLFIHSVDIKVAEDRHGWQSYIRVPRTAAEAVELMKRDFAAALGSGQEQSWVDLFGGAFARPELADALARLQAIARAEPGLRRRPLAEQLLIVDEESLRWTTPGTALAVPLFPVQKQWHLLRSGAPWTQTTLDDFLARDWPAAKLASFVNLFRCDSARRARIHARLRATDCGALWTLWPGAQDGLDAVAGLTGVSARWTAPAAGDWTCRVVGRDGPCYGTGTLRAEYEPLMRGYPPAAAFATAPRLALAPGPGDRTLAVWDDGGEAALVRTDRLGFPSLFNAGPLLPETQLAAFAAACGAHAYAPPGDLVYANDRFLGLYAGAAPVRTVRLRRPARVWDLWEGRWVAETATQAVELRTSPLTCHLWRLEPVV